MLTRRSALSTMLALVTGGAASVAAAQAAPAPAPAHAHSDTEGAKKKSCTDTPDAPKALFQLSNAEDTALVLRVATNYLAVPNASVTIVGYNTGGEFMLKNARDSNGKLYAEQINRLADRGVVFKACNNWLKSKNLTADALVSPVAVVPSGAIEILRLQNEEHFAYFRP
jgi:intracellular sulfur oxidation DsrE/DsrF family protein